MDAPKTLGQRIVEAAWMAVGLHLQSQRLETDSGQRSGTHGWRPAGRGMRAGAPSMGHGPSPASFFTDEELPGGNARGSDSGPRPFFAEGEAA